MRIDALQAFVAIAESGSFQAAADRLHLSQPGISKRVAALEARLGGREPPRLQHDAGGNASGDPKLSPARGRDA